MRAFINKLEKTLFPCTISLNALAEKQRLICNDAMCLMQDYSEKHGENGLYSRNEKQKKP